MRAIDERELERVKEFILGFQREYGISPSFRKIDRHMKWNDLAKVYRYTNALVSRDIIQKTQTGKIVTPFQLTTGKNIIAPMVGTVPCGEPEVAIEDIEGSYALPVDLFGNSEKFILRAKGESMIEAGIRPGDLLVVEKRNVAVNGEIVIAMIQEFGDGEATAKRYYLESSGKIRLHPENNTMQDMVFDCDQVIICGVVVNSIKSF